MRIFIVLVTILLATLVTNAQTCPEEDERGIGEAPVPSVLHGTLLVHDDLRHWLGIKLDQPACGQTQVQLVFSNDEERRKAETLRGCNVAVTGKMFGSPTGYYSAAMAISDPTLQPGPFCHPHPLEPDPSAVPIPATVAAYHASITVDYRGKGYIAVKVWQGEDKSELLTPWQAYITYSLTGGADVIWFGCQKDFRIKAITQTPQNPNALIDEQPTGSVLQDQNGTNVIKFTCLRESQTAPFKR